jgi:hypothetical protein
MLVGCALHGEPLHPSQIGRTTNAPDLAEREIGKRVTLSGNKCTTTAVFAS